MKIVTPILTPTTVFTDDHRIIPTMVDKSKENMNRNQEN